MNSPVHAGPGRRRVIVLTAVILLVMAAGIWFWIIKPSASNPVLSAGPGPRPGRMGSEATISVAPVTQGAFPVVVRAVGTVTPFNTVTVLPQVEGRLLRTHVQEGARVKAGELLAELDPRSLQATLAEAEGTQAQNQAELQQARRDLARYEQLFRQDSIARQQLDTQRALVRQLEGRRATDRARIDSARLQLDHTRILAPVDGRLGLLKANVGSLIGPGSTDGLASIVQTDPISVLFSVPEVQLQALREAVAAAGGQGLEVEAWDRGERRRLASGRVATLDNQIDATTGSLRVRARFDNPDESLFPNQFVNIRLLLKTLPDALSVPVDTVQFGNQGNYVYKILDGKAHVQAVTLGVSAQDRVEVLSGLQAGDQVALEGLDRLREGARVRVVSSMPGDGESLPATGGATDADQPAGQAGAGQAGTAAASDRRRTTGEADEDGRSSQPDGTADGMPLDGKTPAGQEGPGEGPGAGDAPPPM